MGLLYCIVGLVEEVPASPVDNVPRVETGGPILHLVLRNHSRIIDHSCKDTALVDSSLPKLQRQAMVSPDSSRNNAQLGNRDPVCVCDRYAEAGHAC